MRRPTLMPHGPLTEERAVIYRLMEKEYAAGTKGLRARRLCYQRIAASRHSFAEWKALQPQKITLPSWEAFKALQNEELRRRVA